MRYSGIVARGVGRAAKLGAPTLNIVLPDLHLSGIYAARVELKGHTYDAAAFADPKRNILETHLFDFSDDVDEGATITIELFKKIRESKTFEDDESLKNAITSDISEIKKYFASLAATS